MRYLKVLHAKERPKELNNDGNKPNLGRLWRRLNFRLGWSAM